MASVGRRAQDGEAPASCPTSRGPTHEAAGGEPVFGAEVGRAAPGGGAEAGCLYPMDSILQLLVDVLEAAALLLEALHPQAAALALVTRAAQNRGATTVS